MTDKSEGFDLKAHLREIELKHLATALDQAQGNHAKAARLLGLNRTTLVEKMRRAGYKLNPPPERVKKQENKE
jgi:sigma-54 specific flagellar transcriptional regulator A